MKTNSILALCLFPVAALVLSLTSCDVKKVKDGEMPEVKVEGDVKFPKYDIKVPDVNIGKKKVEVVVPTIDITLPKDSDHPAPVDANGNPK